jgi:aryl-alcohol dehydrogenase-like predicted oxidoreductase
MRYKKLGQTNIEISSIGLGCMGMSVAYGKPDDKESIATLEKALELGVNFWDTSDAYGDNEVLIANVLVPHRKQVVIATKFGWRGTPQNGKVDNSPAWIRQALEDSLKRLKTDVIDLYYVHRLDPNIPVEETVGILSGLVREGKIRAIGLSEISEGTLRKAHAVHPIAALQSEYSLLSREVEKEVLPACQELGTTFVAFSPTARGLLTNTPIDPKKLPGDDRRVTSIPRFSVDEYYQNNLQLAQAFRELAAAKNCTASQLALAWLLEQAEHVVPIPGTKKRKYLIENAGATDIVLNTADLQRIEAILLEYPNTGPRYNEAFLKLVGK